MHPQAALESGDNVPTDFPNLVPCSNVCLFKVRRKRTHLSCAANAALNGGQLPRPCRVSQPSYRDKESFRNCQMYESAPKLHGLAG